MMTMALSCVPLTKPAASVFRLWTNYSLRCSCCPQDRNHWPWQRKSEFLSHLELDFNPDQGCTVSSSYVPNYWCSTWAWMKEEGIIYRIVSLLVLGDLGGLQLDWLCVQKQRDIYYTIKRMAPWLITWRCTAWCFYIGLAITLHCYPSCMNTPAKMQPLGKSRDFVAALDADKTNSFNMIQVQGKLVCQVSIRNQTFASLLFTTTRASLPATGYEVWVLTEMKRNRRSKQLHNDSFEKDFLSCSWLEFMDVIVMVWLITDNVI